MAANCYIKWFDSPAFEPHMAASKKLGNSNNKQAFIFTKRHISAGEELRCGIPISNEQFNFTCAGGITALRKLIGIKKHR